MEFKVIIYIIAGIVYFIYSMKKNSDEKTASKSGKPNVNPPVGNPLEDILAEIKRKQLEAQKQAQLPKSSPKPVEVYQQKQIIKTKTQPKYQSPKDILVHEKRVASFEEGKTNFESIFERDLTEEEKIIRGDIKIDNEGIYKIESLEERDARESEETKALQINPREALIGSLIFERKF